MIVEDDSDQREATAKLLMMKQDFEDFEIAEILEAADAKSALEMIESRTPDLILCDNCLDTGPGGEDAMSGVELCEVIRSKGITSPVIILSGKKTSPEERASGLEKGAYDYMVKPFDFQELLARIQVQLTRYENSVGAVFKIGPFEFNQEKQQLVNQESGRSELLTQKECRILRFLYLARGEIVDKRTLLREVWNYNDRVETHTLETHIFRLRNKMEPAKKEQKHILTAPGGYRLAT